MENDCDAWPDWWRMSLAIRLCSDLSLSKAANPRIEVPVLIDDTVQIFESTVILE